MRRTEGVLWTGALGAGLALAGFFFLRLAQVRSDGPLEPAWDRQSCAQCGMLLSDPRFACEVRPSSGETLFFDDPGCLLSYLRAHPQSASPAIYLRRFDAPGWLPLRSAAFMEVPDSPMGYRLACVDPGRTGSHPLAWAEGRVDAESRSRSGGPKSAREGGTRD